MYVYVKYGIYREAECMREISSPSPSLPPARRSVLYFARADKDTG